MWEGRPKCWVRFAQAGHVPWAVAGVLESQGCRGGWGGWSGTASVDNSFMESEAKGEQSERAEAGRVWYLMAHRRSCRPVDRNDMGQQENVMTEGKSGECPGQERGGP